MIFFLKSLSRSVHDEERPNEDQDHRPETASKTEEGTCTTLTVWRKSLVVSCSGFTVINSNGDLVYRVDNYKGCLEELILMDAAGKSILAMRRRKKLGIILDSWDVYEGEEEGDEHYYSRTSSSNNSGESLQKNLKPIWSVRKQAKILQSNHQNVLAHVFRGSSRKGQRYSYVIQGSYASRSCKVMDGSRRVVAEIKRKETMIGGVSYGLEVFLLVVQPGFDPGFAMALILLLDQMFS